MKRTAVIVVLILAIAGAVGYLYKSDTAQEQTKTQQSIEPAVKEFVFTQHEIALDNGLSFSLTAPDIFKIVPAAQSLKRIRFMAWSPDRRLFLTDMKDLSDNSQGKIYIFDDFDKTTGTFATKTLYLDGLRNPNNLAFYKDQSGRQWIYIALTHALVRYEYKDGDIKPSSEPQVVATFPDYGLSYKYGGWHLTRTVAFHNDKAYMSVGSSCNSCEEKLTEPERATIIEINPDGSNKKIFASGLRNAVGIKWVGDDLYATNMAVDHLGADKPDEMFYKIKADTNYGWPYCYVALGQVHFDASKTWQRDFDCNTSPLPEAVFEAHAAPLGLEYFDRNFAIGNIKDSFLVALHGASTLSIGSGPRIIQINKGSTTDLITGFQKGTTRYGRPADIIKFDDQSFFFHR